MNTNLLRLSSLLLFTLVLTACSVTDHIPEGEQLYGGIKSITYDLGKETSAKKRLTAVHDSAGVITSIAEAVETVSKVVNGTGHMSSLSELQHRELNTLTQKERRWLKNQARAEQRTLAKTQEEVAAVLAYEPNGALFGSSSITTPWKFGLWMYDEFVESKSPVGKWLFNTFAEAPILVSNVSPSTRAKVATNTLRKYGYFRGEVEHEVVTGSNPKKARINYLVRPGKLFYLDSISYVKFDPVADSLLSQTFKDRLLRKGDAFSVLNLTSEQSRIEALMRNNGYYYYAPSYTTFQADTMAHEGFVQLRVQPLATRPNVARRPWYIGHTNIVIRDQKGSPLTGKLERRNFSFQYPGDLIPIRPGMWRRAIAHRAGERFSLADQKASLERLYAMGILTSVDIDYVPRDTLGTADTLDLYVSASIGPAYDSSFEMNATLKSNQQFGPGVVYELAKHNAFRGGETVAWKLLGNYEWQMGGGRNGGNSLLNSYEVGTELSFKFPRLMAPWLTAGNTQRRLFERNAQLRTSGQPFVLNQRRPVVGSTTFSLNANWRNRSGFFQFVTMGGNVTYKWYSNPRYTHEFTLLNLDYNRTLSTTAAFDSITSANPALYVSMRDQFIPSMSYTFTYQSRPNRLHPLWLQFTAKESGNLLSAGYAAFGKPFNEQYKLLFGTPFAQFFKATAEARHTRTLTSRLRLATRLFAGAVFSYGNSARAPYGEQFFVGGANSVRAFSVRTIGPGGYYDPGTRYAYIDQTGDFKLEANAELRAPLFGSIHGAVFLDAGNVWLLKRDLLRPDAELSPANLKRIAVGTGLGLRYDMQFLVLRFDVGVGLHAPYYTGRSGFYNIARFRDGLAYHFAIGYPF